jgi:hypothetical protein
VWEPRPSVAIFGIYLRGGRQKNPRAGGSTRGESTRPYGRKRAQSELYRYVPRNAVTAVTSQTNKDGPKAALSPTKKPRASVGLDCGADSALRAGGDK